MNNNAAVIINQQLEFFKARKAGCIFAAIAARNPLKFGWRHHIIENITAEAIDKVISNAINDKNTTTLSIIFPTIATPFDLWGLVQILQKCYTITLQQHIKTEDAVCIGLRVKVGNDLSWVSGFGKFDFLPLTRQAPYTELAFRVKPRPFYDWHMAPPIPGVVHLADMDMLGIPKKVFIKHWEASIINTKKILGHSPDIKSAAKTTFSIPNSLASQ